MDFNLQVTQYPKQPPPDSPERRCEIRFKTTQNAIVTTLDGTAQTTAGSILDVSTRGMRLKLDRPLAVGAPVRIDVEADLILGEIRYCTQQDGCTYELGIEIAHILSNAKEVAARWVQSSWLTAA